MTATDRIKEAIGEELETRRQMLDGCDLRKLVMTVHLSAGGVVQDMVLGAEFRTDKADRRSPR
jgi:hypothetical protein